MNKIIAMAVLLAAVQGCALREPMPAEKEPEIPTLTPRASTYYDLLALPPGEHPARAVAPREAR